MIAEGGAQGNYTTSQVVLKYRRTEAVGNNRLRLWSTELHVVVSDNACTASCCLVTYQLCDCGFVVVTQEPCCIETEQSDSCCRVGSMQQ